MRRVVVVCPGRGSYGRAELGSLFGLRGERAALFGRFDEIRRAEGRETLAALDGAARFSVARHTSGDNAAALIYAAGYADFLSLEGVEVVAVTGNSMGWYTALACAGALSAEAGFRLADGMGTLMQGRGAGGQVVYPVTGPDWAPDAERRAAVLDAVDAIDGARGRLSLSIDLGGTLVLAGDEDGLAAFAAAVPAVDRFPLRLPNHAAFHSPLVAPVAQAARAAFADLAPGDPALPLVDGRGAIWWPRATDETALFGYTLGHQVTEPYDFAAAIRVAAREFAPDAFVLLGPGDGMGAAVAQSLIAANWLGLDGREAFLARQAHSPLILSMGRPEQRREVTGEPQPLV